MRKLASAVVLLAVLCGTSTPGTEARSVPTYRPIRQYFGGLTRTTIYYATGNRTASGLWPHWGLVAADPRLPFGTHVVIPGLGTFIVADRGGAVWGNHLDIFLDYPGQHRVKDYYAGVYSWG